jgi:hypothetical protein
MSYFSCPTTDTVAQLKIEGVAISTSDAVGVPARRTFSSLLAGDRVGLGLI